MMMVGINSTYNTQMNERVKHLCGCVLAIAIVGDCTMRQQPEINYHRLIQNTNPQSFIVHHTSFISIIASSRMCVDLSSYYSYSYIKRAHYDTIVHLYVIRS